MNATDNVSVSAPMYSLTAQCAKAAECAARESTRYALAGAQLSAGDNGIGRVSVTDGRRAIVIRCAAAADAHTMNIPTAALKLAAKSKRLPAAVTNGIPNRGRIESAGISMEFDTDTGRFPSFGDVSPSAEEKHFTIDLNAKLLAGLLACIPDNDECVPVVRLTVFPDKLYGPIALHAGNGAPGSVFGLLMPLSTSDTALSYTQARKAIL